MGFFDDRPLDLAPASVRDHREQARKRLPRQLFDYIDGGAYEESTMRGNESALEALLLRQRVLRDVSAITLSTTVLGRNLRIPVVLAPVGLGGMFARRAEVQAARAAESFGVPFCESTVSICSIEEVAGATAAPIWFQLYVMRDRSYARDLMARAAAAGAEALVLTVDMAVVGERYRDTRNGMTVPVGPVAKAIKGIDLVRHVKWLREVGIGGRPHTFGNLLGAVPGASSPEDFKAWVDAQFDPSVTWGDLAWVREHWHGPLVLKGVLDADDARTAADMGVGALVVSNHGGRQLDATPASVSALPAVVEAAGERVEVLMDGGIRSGLDVVKALSLGARAVLIGRPWAWAVAGGGQAAVSQVLSTMEREMHVAMGLCGRTDVAELDRSVLANL
ncbi:MAG: L-lactate dehydrogenase [Microthrixaceae bacterium]|nr:L-lactate dehydrogenase [Microthrixaceae bacterium]